VVCLVQNSTVRESQHPPEAHDKVNFHSPFTPIENLAIPGSCYAQVSPRKMLPWAKPARSSVRPARRGLADYPAIVGVFGSELGV
jgi:hypothetical protein